MTIEINTKEELLAKLDEFISEISYHSGYKSIIHIMNNPIIMLLSEITGFQPGYFGIPINDGEYVKFDTEKIKRIRQGLIDKLPA